jgi:hypothetical protein
MTRLAAHRRTIELCDARLEAEVAGAEVTLLDVGASALEIEAAIGVDGYARRLFSEARDAQLAAVATWLACGTLH